MTLSDNTTVRVTVVKYRLRRKIGAPEDKCDPIDNLAHH